MPSAVKLDRPGVIPFREGGAATMTENEALARLLQKVENAWLETKSILRALLIGMLAHAPQRKE